MHIPFVSCVWYSVDQVASLNNDQIHFKKTLISLLSKNHNFTSVLKFKYQYFIPQIKIKKIFQFLRCTWKHLTYVHISNFFPYIHTWPWNFFLIRLRFKTHENRQCYFRVSAEGSLLFKKNKIFFKKRITKLLKEYMVFNFCT